MNSNFTNPITPRAADVFYESPPAPDIFRSAELVLVYDCAANRCGPGITITVPAGRFFAASQAEADAAALVFADGQGAAWQGDCGWPSDSFDQDFDCSAGYSGDTVHVHYDAGEFCAVNTGVANSLVLAAAELLAAETLVCSQGQPGLKITATFVYPALASESTRLNEDGTAWVGQLVPPSVTPEFWYLVGRVGGVGNWFKYISGPVDNADSWPFWAGAAPSTPVSGDFNDRVNWAPTPAEIAVTPRINRVGVVAYSYGFPHESDIVLRFENTGIGPLILGPLVITPVRGSGWSLSTDTVPVLAAGEFFDVTVYGGAPHVVVASPANYNVLPTATLAIPNNLPGYGGPEAYIDFGSTGQFDG